MLSVFSLAAAAAPAPAPEIKPLPTPPQPQRKPKPVQKKAPPSPMSAPPPPAEPAPVADRTPASPPPVAPVASTAAPSAPAAGNVAANAGSAGTVDQSRLERAYAMMVNRAVENVQRYPVMARQAQQSGTAQVLLRPTRDGRLLQATLEHPTGFPWLDQEAISAANRVARYPLVPAQLRPGSQEIVLIQPMYWGAR